MVCSRIELNKVEYCVDLVVIGRIHAADSEDDICILIAWVNESSTAWLENGLKRIHCTET
jgi:hypothetical protein